MDLLFLLFSEKNSNCLLKQLYLIILQTFKQNYVLSNVEENWAKECRHSVVSKNRVSSLCDRTVAQHKNKTSQNLITSFRFKISLFSTISKQTYSLYFLRKVHKNCPKFSTFRLILLMSNSNMV